MFIIENIVKCGVVWDYVILRWSWFFVLLIYMGIIVNTSQYNAVQYDTTTYYDLSATTEYLNIFKYKFNDTNK